MTAWTDVALTSAGSQSANIKNVADIFLVHKYAECHHLDRQHVTAHADALQSFPRVRQAGDDHRQHSGLEVRELDVAWASSSLETGDVTSASCTDNAAHLYSYGV